MSEANTPARARDRAHDRRSERYFFEDATAVQRLRADAADWLGRSANYREPTPFRKMSIAKGPTGGVDCAGLVQALLIAAGVGGEREWKFPRDPADYEGHVAKPKILSYLRGTGAVPSRVVTQKGLRAVSAEDTQAIARATTTIDPQSALLAEIFAEIEVPKWEGNPPDDLFMPGDLWVLQRKGLVHLPVILHGRRFVNVIPRRWVEEGNIQNSAFNEHFIALFRARSDAGRADYLASRTTHPVSR